MNVLKNECGLSVAWTPAVGGTPPPMVPFQAIWDTGATNCVITQAVIDACGLAPTGMAQVHGVHGPSTSETYLVNIALPNHVVITGVRVTKGDLIGADILIGMNIINRGDFAVTNLDGVTKFSFRIPSAESIDFVADSKKQPPQFQHGGQHKARAKRPQTYGKKKRKRKR